MCYNLTIFKQVRNLTFFRYFWPSVTLNELENSFSEKVMSRGFWRIICPSDPTFRDFEIWPNFISYNRTSGGTKNLRKKRHFIKKPIILFSFYIGFYMICFSILGLLSSSSTWFLVWSSILLLIYVTKNRKKMISFEIHVSYAVLRGGHLIIDLYRSKRIFRSVSY